MYFVAYLPSNFRLYYTVNNKQKVMEPKRCLLFYRLAKGETLTFKECDEPSYEKTLQNLVVGTSVCLFFFFFFVVIHFYLLWDS